MSPEEQKQAGGMPSDFGIDWTQSAALHAHLKSLNLDTHNRSALIFSVIPHILSAISQVAKALRTSHEVALAGTANLFGDDQLNVDVIAEDIIRAALSQCPSVKTASSEEDPVEKPVLHSSAENPSQEEYTVAFDPLDGSSIIAPNWTVGTIVGIWEGTSALGQDPRKKQVAAILGVFGPRSTAIVAIRTPETICRPICFEVGLHETTQRGIISAEIGRPEVRFSPESEVTTKYFAPANLRAAAEDEHYMALVNELIKMRYTLRYSGGLVPDVVHALVKGHGVYISPVTENSKAKLRRLYELCPLALVVECAGGQAVDSTDGKGVLDRPIGNCDERGGLICGTSNEVDFAAGMLVVDAEAIIERFCENFELDCQGC
ncbi:Sedoheptulose-1,7-bisphosphatase, chloroplastic [Rhypophila decipiens]|uniref:fructose-bisphosphatase n=1 Tax=Rhypophila decipiens TaxID=261697 RepID=A0AAN7B4Q0_9PEZI|nr:Sedoheptulose-1,7-bisphosphatase, chloroplastic [Rhypophila decipiens]